MARRGTDGLIPTEPSLRPARQFFEGFAEGFGFAGLFAQLEQEPLPLADAMPAELPASDRELAEVVVSLANHDRALLPGEGHSPEGTVHARAAK